MKRRVSLGDFLRRWLHGATDYEPFRDLHGLLRRLFVLVGSCSDGFGAEAKRLPCSTVSSTGLWALTAEAPARVPEICNWQNVDLELAKRGPLTFIASLASQPSLSWRKPTFHAPRRQHGVLYGNLGPPIFSIFAEWPCCQRFA